MAMRTELQRRAPTSGSRATTFWEKAGRDLEKIGKDIEAALADFTRDVEKMMSDFVGSMQFLDKLVVLPAVVDARGVGDGTTAQASTNLSTAIASLRSAWEELVLVHADWAAGRLTGQRRALAAIDAIANAELDIGLVQDPSPLRTAEGSPVPRSLRSRRPTPTSSSSNVPERRLAPAVGVDATGVARLRQWSEVLGSQAVAVGELTAKLDGFDGVLDEIGRDVVLAWRRSVLAVLVSRARRHDGACRRAPH